MNLNPITAYTQRTRRDQLFATRDRWTEVAFQTESRGLRVLPQAAGLIAANIDKALEEGSNDRVIEYLAKSAYKAARVEELALDKLSDERLHLATVYGMVRLNLESAINQMRGVANK